MDSFNKVISFILGLVVVIVFLAVVSRRIDLTKNLLPLSRTGSAVTATPAVSPASKTGTPSPTSGYNRYQTNQTTAAPRPSTIPATGSPTLFIPFAISALFAGLQLKRKV